MVDRNHSEPADTKLALPVFLMKCELIEFPHFEAWGCDANLIIEDLELSSHDLQLQLEDRRNREVTQSKNKNGPNQWFYGQVLSGSVVRSCFFSYQFPSHVFISSKSSP